MAKQTLLDMTQEILSALSSDEVNSISDTTESLQIANIIKRKYYDIVTRGSLPDDDQPFQLTASGDTTQPVLMTIPATVTKIRWIKYFDSNSLDSSEVSQFSHALNTDISSTPIWVTSSVTSNSVSLGSKTFTVASGLAVIVGEGVIAESGPNTLMGTVTSYASTTLVINVTATIGTGTYTSWVIGSNASQTAPAGYKYVTILPFDQFMEMVNVFNPSDSNVRSYTFVDNGQNFIFYYKNDHQPQYCTVLSNHWVLFDSYDVNLDNTLQTSKTLCYGQVVPAFTISDSFIPVMDDNQFPLLINEAKALAYFELKQQPHIKAEQEIKRQWSAVQKNKSMADRPTYFNQLANFGRIPRTGGYGGYVLRNYR